MQNWKGFTMQVISTLAEYEKWRFNWHGRKTALVPTMGALHEGHQALIRMARNVADGVVVSIFVNPLQFGPQEDLAAYPRPLEKDLEICRQLGVDVVFAPTVEEMYPGGMAQVTTVVPPEAMAGLYCGAFRPGHFAGVVTVVLKLLNIIRPQMAIFGEKDAQQLAVIRKMIQDLHVPVDILSHLTVRDVNGLALSSRNQYLKSEAEQQAALSLYRILSGVQEALTTAQSPLPAQETLDKISAEILSHWQNASVLVKLQYLAAVDSDTLQPVDRITPGTRLLIAAYVNNVRLIDNLKLQ